MNNNNTKIGEVNKMFIAQIFRDMTLFEKEKSKKKSGNCISIKTNAIISMD